MSAGDELSELDEALGLLREVSRGFPTGSASKRWQSRCEAFLAKHTPEDNEYVEAYRKERVKQRLAELEAQLLQIEKLDSIAKHTPKVDTAKAFHDAVQAGMNERLSDLLTPGQMGQRYFHTANKLHAGLEEYRRMIAYLKTAQAAIEDALDAWHEFDHSPRHTAGKGEH